MKEGRTEWRTGIAGLEHIKDSRAEFIENLLKAFEKDHPEFIEQLKDRGLNEEEIRYCCLEVLGGEGIVVFQRIYVLYINI